MKRIVQFNQDNWQVIFTHSASVTMTGEKSYIPLPPVATSILLDKDIAAVSMTTVPPQNKNWRFGGWVEQCFFSGLIVGPEPDVAGPSHRIMLDRITVLMFDPVSADYNLKFYFPKWFRNVSLTCWQYTGQDEDSLTIQMASSMAGINFQLDNLHQKVDQLL